MASSYSLLVFHFRFVVQGYLQKEEVRDSALDYVEAPCTDRYARWCKKSAPSYGGRLFDFRTDELSPIYFL